MKDVSPRKAMAMGETDHDDFGVGKMHGDDHLPGESGRGKMLADHERAAGQPVKHTRGRLAAQANADHGPHGKVGRGSGM